MDPILPGEQHLMHKMQKVSEEEGRARAQEFKEKIGDIDINTLEGAVVITIHQAGPEHQEEDGKTLGLMSCMTFGPAHLIMGMAAKLAQIALELNELDGQRGEVDPTMPYSVIHDDHRH